MPTINDLWQSLFDDIGNVQGQSLNQRLHYALSQGVTASASNIAAPESFGAVGDGVADDTQAIQDFFDDIVSNNKIGILENKTYKINRTISPNGTFTVICNDTVFLVDVTGTFNDVPNKDASDSGVDVFFNTKNTFRSVLIGSLHLISTGIYPTSIPSTLAAFSADATGSHGTWSVDNILISKFGYGFFQSDQSTPGTAILPFTRNTYKNVTIQQCIFPMWFGNGGNGFDDCFISSLRITRSLSYAYINATELAAGVVFLSGLPATDMLVQKGSITSGTPNLTLSDTSTLVINDFVSIVGAATNGQTLVAKVTNVVGTAVTLDRNAGATVSGADLYRNPPIGILCRNAAVCANRFYVENMFRKCIELRDSNFNVQELKVSGGAFSSEKEAAIICNHIDASVSLTLSPTGSPKINNVVYLGTVSSSGTLSRRNVNVVVPAKITAEPIKLDAPTEVLSGHTSESSTVFLNDNLVAVVGGTPYKYPTRSAAIRVNNFSRSGGYNSQMFSSRVGAISVGAGATTEIVPSSGIAPNATMLVTGNSISASIRLFYFVAVSGGGVLNFTPLEATGGSFSTSGGNLRVTNSTGGTETISWSVIYLRNENVSGVF